VQPALLPDRRQSGRSHQPNKSLRPGWNHVIRGGRVVRAATPAVPNPIPGPVTESPTRKEATNTSKKGKTAKSAPKVTVVPKQAPVTKSNKPAKPGKPSQPKPKELVVPTQPVTH